MFHCLVHSHSHVQVYEQLIMAADTQTMSEPKKLGAGNDEVRAAISDSTTHAMYQIRCPVNTFISDDVLCTVVLVSLMKYTSKVPVHTGSVNLH